MTAHDPLARYTPAIWYGLTPVHAASQSVGLSLKADDGRVHRFRLPLANFASLTRASVGEAVDCMVGTDEQTEIRDIRDDLLLDWEQVLFGEPLDIFHDPPIPISSLFVGIDRERMAASLGLLRSVAELVATAAVRLSDGDFARLISREHFELLGELRNVLLKERVACLNIDGAGRCTS